MPETPWFPHVQCDDQKSLPILWGKGGWLFILAMCAVLGTSGLSAYRVDAAEEDVQEMKEDIGTLATNQHVMDEAQRIEAAKTALMIKQLNALLMKEGVTERILAPAVKPSTLEKIE
jgi:hypothetical protein